MGQESKHKSGSARVEEERKDGQVHSADRRHIIELKNMSLQEIYDMAYEQGFEDGMSFIETPKIAHG